MKLLEHGTLGTLNPKSVNGKILKSKFIDAVIIQKHVKQMHHYLNVNLHPK